MRRIISTVYKPILTNEPLTVFWSAATACGRAVTNLFLIGTALGLVGSSGVKAAIDVVDAY